MAQVMEFYVTGEDSNGTAMDADNSVDEIGQWFTIGQVGTNTAFSLSTINIKIFKTGSPGNLTISLYNSFEDGLPNGAAISTGSITAAEVTGTAAWYPITMSAVSLRANGKYAVMLSGTTSTGNTYNWRVDVGGGYAGGQSLDFNGTVYANQTPDVMFEIVGGSYAGTLCTLANAINKAGAKASTISTNETLVSDFVIQAEGVINAVTRFDWVGAYSGLTDQVKFILNQVASDMAAIYMISYDMSGFTDRVEAETMINVYREAIARGLSLLRNQEVKDFITGDT